MEHGRSGHRTRTRGSGGSSFSMYDLQIQSRYPYQCGLRETTLCSDPHAGKEDNLKTGYPLFTDTLSPLAEKSSSLTVSKPLAVLRSFAAALGAAPSPVVQCADPRARHFRPRVNRYCRVLLLATVTRVWLFLVLSY